MGWGGVGWGGGMGWGGVGWGGGGRGGVEDRCMKSDWVSFEGGESIAVDDPSVPAASVSGFGFGFRV